MANEDNCTSPSAACTRERLLQIRSAQGQRHPIWLQTLGETTIDTTDDVFELKFDNFLHDQPVRVSVLEQEQGWHYQKTHWWNDVVYHFRHTSSCWSYMRCKC